MAPGMLLAPLKELFHDETIKEACESVKKKIKDETLGSSLDQLTAIKYETSEDLAEFALVARSLAPLPSPRARRCLCPRPAKARVLGHPEPLVSLRHNSRAEPLLPNTNLERPKPPKGKKAKEGAGAGLAGFAFPGDLLLDLSKSDAIDILHKLQLPEPAGPLFTQAMAVAVKAHVLLLAKDSGCVEDLKQGDFGAGAGKLLCTPELVAGLEQLKPGVLKAPIQKLFALPALAAAVEQAKEHMPDHALKELLDAVVKHEWDSEGAVKQFARKLRKLVEYKLPEKHGFFHNLKEGVKDIMHKSFGKSFSQSAKAPGAKSSSKKNVSETVQGSSFGASFRSNSKKELASEGGQHADKQGFTLGVFSKSHRHTRAAETFEFPASLIAKLDRNDIIDVLKSLKLPSPVGPLLAKAIDGVLAAELFAQAQDLIKDLRDGKLEQA
eukprot:2707360-Rhodomonas_salina.3